MSYNLKFAFLFLTNKSSPESIKKFLLLEKGIDEMGDAFFLFHSQTHNSDDSIKDLLNKYLFDDNILYSLGYRPIGYNLLPGSNHFPIFKFYRNNPQYDFYWCIEDDVLYNGEWKDFFLLLKKSQKI